MTMSNPFHLAMWSTVAWGACEGGRVSKESNDLWSRDQNRCAF